MEQTAHRFLQTLTAQQWIQLDQSIQDHVLAAREGLQQALIKTTDLFRHLLAPLLSQAVSCLSSHLPITDVAQVELDGEDQAARREANDCALAKRIHKYYRLAAPVLEPMGNKRASNVCQAVAADAADNTPILRPDVAPTESDPGFLLVPASDAGKQYGERAKRVLPDLQLVNVPGQADLMFCREQTQLSLEDLEGVLRASRAAYEETVNTPLSSPHSRFDIQDWMPLDP